MSFWNGIICGRNNQSNDLMFDKKGSHQIHIVYQTMVHFYNITLSWPNDRKWKFPFISVLRYVKQMFSFWGFWNFCFQFVSFGSFRFWGVLTFNALQLGSRFSRRRSWWSLAHVSSSLQQPRHCHCSLASVQRPNVQKMK